MGLNFLETLLYSSKYAKPKSCAGVGAHLAVIDTSVEKQLASHAHAASPHPLARTHDTNTKRNRNQSPD